MDLIAHCTVAEWSGVFKEDEIYGSGIEHLMFLNLMHCHDWAYRHCWHIARFETLRLIVKRIQAHMIADWVIHYGEERTDTKKKSGWAYRHMGQAHKWAPDFFRTAAHLGLLKPSTPEVSKWTPKQKLDFAHSMTEYALDFFLSKRSMSPQRLASIKRSLSRVDEHCGARLLLLFDRLGAYSDHSKEFIQRSLAQIAADARAITDAKDFCLFTALHKYDFKYCPDSIEYLRCFIEKLVDTLDEDDAVKTCERVAAIIKEPMTIYTGDCEERKYLDTTSK